VLHLTDGERRRRLLSAAGYAAILAAAGLTWLLAGPRPFADDAGPLQRATGLLFALAGAAAFRLPGVPFAFRALLATAAAWLAVDEWLMVHECLKFGPLAGLSSRGGRDAPILAYAAAGVLAAAWLVRRIRPSAEALAHGVAAAVAVGVVLLVDVAGALHGPAAEVLEETAELLAAWASIAFCAAAAGAHPSAPWRQAFLVAAWSPAWLGAVAWLLRPLFCPARFL
jgi:hypothetical protein